MVRPRPLPSPYNRCQGVTQPRYVAALSQLLQQEEQSKVIINPASSQELKYWHFIRGPNRDTLVKALTNNLGRLPQGFGTRMPTFTNTVFFVEKSSSPYGRKVTYAQIVATI